MLELVRRLLQDALSGRETALDELTLELIKRGYGKRKICLEIRDRSSLIPFRCGHRSKLHILPRLPTDRVEEWSYCNRAACGGDITDLCSHQYLAGGEIVSPHSVGDGQLCATCVRLWSAHNGNSFSRAQKKKFLDSLEVSVNRAAHQVHRRCFPLLSGRDVRAASEDEVKRIESGSRPRQAELIVLDSLLGMGADQVIVVERMRGLRVDLENWYREATAV